MKERWLNELLFSEISMNHRCPSQLIAITKFVSRIMMVESAQSHEDVTKLDPAKFKYSNSH